MGGVDETENSLQRSTVEPLGCCEDSESHSVQSPSTEFHKSDLEVLDTCAFEPATNVLENTICNVPDQNSKQLNITESIKMQSHETADLQDDRSSLEPKNVKSKHAKPVIHSKQNVPTETPRKIVAAKHEGLHNKTKVNIKGVKRNADEAESQQNCYRPVKVRKKQVEKDPKVQSCNSGVKSVKNQGHSVLKKTTQDQHLAREHHPAHIGNVPHPSQKQCQKPQQSAPVVKATGHMKEEQEQPSEYVKEEDKMKQKKPEKNLQPRQRRSSRSFSLDEPPLFIPDNIATVKREGSDHCSSFESKYMWTPSKQCGFCKKPHGNRCVCMRVCMSDVYIEEKKTFEGVGLV
jgi:hypothetical protein